MREEECALGLEANGVLERKRVGAGLGMGSDVDSGQGPGMLRLCYKRGNREICLVGQMNRGEDRRNYEYDTNNHRRALAGGGRGLIAGSESVVRAALPAGGAAARAEADRPGDRCGEKGAGAGGKAESWKAES